MRLSATRLGTFSQGLDPDATLYIAAVETADGQALEGNVRLAINNFVLGCKADGIWSAIKASCILAGARTLSGALVPLVGTAPTNFNFVSGDYSRKTGLVGDGSTKYLNSNRANNADPQNSSHISIWVSAASNGYYMASNVQVSGSNAIFADFPNTRETWGSRSLSFAQYTSNTHTATGFKGLSRSASASFITRTNTANTTFTDNSLTPDSGAIYILARNSNTDAAAVFSSARLAFYSIGESLDLARLDSRVTDLINAFGAAIP